MIRMPSLLTAALAVALPSLASAQHSVSLDVRDGSTLDWAGQSTLGALHSNDTEADLGGRLRVRLAPSPAGPTAELTGVLRLESTVGTVLGPAGGVIARAAFRDVVLGLAADAAPVTSLPGGGLAFDFHVRARFQSGMLFIDPAAGASSSVDLTGTPADRFHLTGRLVNDGGTWRLAAPLRLQLRFDDGAGFAGEFRFRGALRAHVPCDPVRPFCSQGAGAPHLRALPPSSGTLRFGAHASAAGDPVILFGGQRHAPITVSAGDLCIGHHRRVLALAVTGPAGNALLEWQPGPAGLAALQSGSFAVQAVVRSDPAALTNALALQVCR